MMRSTFFISGDPNSVNTIAFDLQKEFTTSSQPEFAVLGDKAGLIVGFEQSGEDVARKIIKDMGGNRVALDSKLVTVLPSAHSVNEIKGQRFPIGSADNLWEIGISYQRLERKP